MICAEVLRQENFGGRIIMASKDELLPYDKTRLSKVFTEERQRFSEKCVYVYFFKLTTIT